MTEAAPTKLFREEAKAETVKCLGCGGPIALHGFGAVQRVVCPFCGSALAPEDSGALALLMKAERQRQISVLPLHARGKIDGVTWEVIGICWRRCVVDGIAYPWQEFLLFNPYKGYRWLLYAMSDGHWSFGQTLSAAPTIADTRHHAIELKKRRYKHFQGADAVVTYVEGEFTWEVWLGDSVHIDDFVDPPEGISVEQSAGEDGVELNRSRQRHITPQEVWAAFGQPGKPPRASGVGPLQPNPWRKQLPSLWISCGLLLVAWFFAVQHVSGRSTEHELFNRDGILFDAPLSEEVTIGEAGKETTVEVTFTAHPLNNSWAFAEVMLVNLETEEAVGLGLDAEYYSGIDGGESWSEGDTRPTEVVGGVPGGRYLLQVNPQRDAASLSAGYAPFGPNSPTHWGLRIREDVFLVRYAVLPLLIILIFPVIALILSARFERRRWSSSDYSE